MKKNLVELFNSVARKTGRTNQTITGDDLRDDTLNRSQKQMLDAINDEIELLLSEHSWLTTQVHYAELETASSPDKPTLNSVAGQNASGQPERTLYVKISYNWPHEETTPSDTASITIAQDEYLEVEAPGTEKRAESWNLYVGETKDQENLQNQDVPLNQKYNEEDDGGFSFTGDSDYRLDNVAQYTLRGKGDYPVDYRYIEELAIPKENDELHFVPNDDWTEFTLDENQQSINSIPDYYRILRLDHDQRPIIEVYPPPDQSYTVEYSYHQAFCRLTAPEDHAPVEDQLVIFGASMTLLDIDDQQFDLLLQRYNRNLTMNKERNKPTSDDLVYGSGDTNTGEPRGPRFPRNINA